MHGPASPTSTATPTALRLRWLPAVVPGLWSLGWSMRCTASPSTMDHALSEESLPPRVPLQCLTGDSAAAALNGTQRRPARHRRWKHRGLGGPGGAVGLALPTLHSASPVVEPRPTEEGGQPITLQHCSWEKTGVASEPVGHRVWLALGPVPPLPRPATRPATGAPAYTPAQPPASVRGFQHTHTCPCGHRQLISLAALIGTDSTELEPWG